MPLTGLSVRLCLSKLANSFRHLRAESIQWPNAAV
jgi:hypothetical protein